MVVPVIHGRASIADVRASKPSGALAVRLQFRANARTMRIPRKRRSTDKGFCVLVIMDNADLRRIYAEYLRTKGWVVFTAHDGRRGLRKALELTPDVIVLDLVTPQVDGWTTLTTLKTLRDSSWTERIPVVILTAATTTRDEAFHVGCDAFLTSPCPPEVLFLQIRSLMWFRPHVSVSLGVRPRM
jgi:CheY-like chemotaxis protein